MRPIGALREYRAHIMPVLIYEDWQPGSQRIRAHENSSESGVTVIVCIIPVLNF